MFLPFLTYCLTCLTAVLSALQLCSLSSNFFWSLHHLIREATLRGIMDPSYVLQLWKIPFDIQTAFISPCLRWESVSWRRRNCVDCADEMGYQHEPHTAAGSALWFKSVSGGMGVWLGSSRKGNWILPLEKTVLESVCEAFEAWACGFQSYETLLLPSERAQAVYGTGQTGSHLNCLDENSKPLTKDEGMTRNGHNHIHLSKTLRSVLFDELS